MHDSGLSPWNLSRAEETHRAVGALRASNAVPRCRQGLVDNDRGALHWRIGVEGDLRGCRVVGAEGLGDRVDGRLGLAAEPLWEVGGGHFNLCS